MKYIKSAVSALLLATAAVSAAMPPVSGSTPDAISVANVMNKYLPGTCGLGTLKVESVKINDATKTVTVTCNENTAYIPFTAETLAQLKDDIRATLGKKYKDYSVTVNAVSRNRRGEVVATQNFDELVLFSPKKVIGPTEKSRFVTNLGAQPAPKGMDGANIAVWQSHGWYFEPKLNRWEWQRARIFQTVEDLYTQSYVMPYLMPMLQNAGAYVMSPRERDTNTIEMIVDNDPSDYTMGKYAEQGQWSPAKIGFGYTKKNMQVGDNPFKQGTARIAPASDDESKAPKATWSARFKKPGKYAVYVSYASMPESATDALYRINDKAGTHEYKVNQKMGGGTWIYLGHFDFDAGLQTKPVVELVGVSGDKNALVSADAVKIGGGMGNVARIVKEPLDSIDYQYQTSGYPRFTEGARYFLQWAGAPDSIYTPTDNVNDYTDDYRCRGEWVNWLAGGSSMLPQHPGLNIPVDLSFAFHSDAGTTMNDSIIGTLAIYSTEGREFGPEFANGSSRMASRDLTDLVLTNIVNDIRRVYEPNWTRRGMWDKTYFEARVPEVPAMLLEMLSHQNFADMKYGLDPEFRFLVSRAIYKGMLEFLANRDGRQYVVTPLAPRCFAIAKAGKKDHYTLTWQATKDSLEATAVPTYYLIEERIGNGAFRQVAKVTKPEWTVTVTDSEIHSYRIIAGNEGGVSFPGEVLALCNVPNAIGTVNIVNGFTRVSAPDWFDSGEIAGFYNVRDGGVPDGEDISLIGEMFEFRRDIPWMDDDAAGFGASRANLEDKVIAGNTRDYVALHGAAVANAGYSFVSTSVDAYMNAPVSAGDAKIVDLILGKQKEIKKGRGVYGTYYKTFPSELQNKIAAATAAGTSFFVSGAFVATDLWDNPNSSKEVAEADQKFATEVLGYHWRVGQASVTGEAYQVPTRFDQFTGGEYTFSNMPNQDCYVVESPDSFYPSDDKRGCTFMRYTENNLIGGTALNAGGYRTVVIGFPFETIHGGDARASLMKQVLDFLDNRQMPDGTKFTPSGLQADKSNRSERNIGVAGMTAKARQSMRRGHSGGKAIRINGKPTDRLPAQSTLK